MIKIKEIKGYEGLYLIDSLGNVVSMPKQDGSRFVNEYNILKTSLSNCGYKRVALAKDNKMKTFSLHRLLAIHFIDNPNNYPCVNHKNGIKTDNRLENLEWCTSSQNAKHAYDNNLGRLREWSNAGLKWLERYTYTKIILIDKEGKEYVFNNTKDACAFANTSLDNISRAIRRGQRTRGYKVYGEKQMLTGKPTSKRYGNPVGNSGKRTCNDYSSEGK